MGFFTRITEGLKKTRESMMRRLDEVAASFGKIDQELFDEIEEVLILADVGVATSQKIVEELKAAVKEVCTGTKVEHIYYKDTKPSAEEILAAVREMVSTRL